MPAHRSNRPLTVATVLLSSFVAAIAPAVAQSPPALTKVAAFDHQVTGIAVGKDGRIFVTFPRWSEDAPVSVAELKDGKPVPYPNAEWNSWRNALKDKVDAKDHFVCVQTAEFDHAGNLWVQGGRADRASYRTVELQALCAVAP